MNPNEPSGVEPVDPSAFDAESLLRQMPLRSPSQRLDAAITGILLDNEANSEAGLVNVGFVPDTARFGWNAILATAIAALLAGLWLGCFVVPNWKLLAKSNPTIGDGSSHAEASLLPTGLFNVQAFNLFHGHSQKAEFENCGQCHQQEADDGNRTGEVFRDWFYGDKHFFEAHPVVLTDCFECHLMVDAAEEEPIPKNVHQKFGKLVNCSDCHKVEADGFRGFEKDWHSALMNSSKG